MNPLLFALWAFLVFSQCYSNAEAEAKGAAEEIMEVEKLAADPGPRPCSITFKKVGCYKDKRKKSERAMKDMLFQDRYKGKGYSGRRVDWGNWATYLPKLVCRCAEAAVKKRYTFFGVQYYGECFSSGDAGRRFHMYGQKTGCIDPFYKECDVSNNIPCVGKGYRNFVYEIVEESASGGGPPVNPVE